MDKISCPNCNRLVDPNDVECPYCGVNLALAATLAQELIQASSFDESTMPISPEILIPRLGDYLVEKGLISPLNLEEALKVQKASQEKGSPLLLGQALIEMGVIDQRTLDKVITEQIFQLQAALRRANQELEDRVSERTADLRHALNRLSELNQLKSNFVSNVSHELKTPLTHLRGYLELLLDGELGELGDNQMKALSVMMKSEKRLEKLINDLIQFSVADKSGFELKLSDINVRELIDSVLGQLKPKIQSKGINVLKKVDSDIIQVRGDYEKLIWVMVQLLENAIKFTPKNGQVEIGAHLVDGIVSLYVTDNGIGISEEKIEEIFDPFYQLDGATTRKYSGTGLGLALAKRIIEAHGTNIKVHSIVGKGSTFEFQIPSSQP